MKNVIYFILGSLLVFTSCKKDASNPISPNEDALTVTYSGKVYHKVKIGNQTWMKENLDVGVMIDSLQNPSNNGTIEKYCYRNDTANCSKYGGLYRWDEAMAYDTVNGAKGICPTGWHIPTRAEFNKLAAEADHDGNALKAVGQGKGSGMGTDLSGFSGLLGGGHFYHGDFCNLGFYAYIWSSTENDVPSDTKSAYSLGLWYEGGGIFLETTYWESGFSIRCIKDE